MASQGSKHRLRKALNEEKRAPLRRYIREMVQEDGPIRTERLLSSMLQHRAVTPEGFCSAMQVLSQEGKANLRNLKRRFPETWHSR